MLFILRAFLFVADYINFFFGRRLKNEFYM